MRPPNYWKIKPFKPAKIHFNLDSDRDKVMDWRDCQPFNPWKQDSKEKERIKKCLFKKGYRIKKYVKELAAFQADYCGDADTFIQEFFEEICNFDSNEYFDDINDILYDSSYTEPGWTHLGQYISLLDKYYEEAMEEKGYLYPQNWGFSQGSDGRIEHYGYVASLEEMLRERQKWEKKWYGKVYTKNMNDAKNFVGHFPEVLFKKIVRYVKSG